MAITERQLNILNYIKMKGFASTEELAHSFEITLQTARRDLKSLSSHNKINRHHGGASVVSNRFDIAYTERKVSKLKEKKIIAKAIAEQIPSGSSLFINIGTTVETIAEVLADKEELFVVTNSLNVAYILSKSKNNITVIIAGGEIRKKDGGIMGETAKDFISRFKMDYAVIGVSGIDKNGNLLDFNYNEATIAETMIKKANCSIVAADHSKFGRDAMVTIAHLRSADKLFTDRKIDNTFKSFFSMIQILY